MVQEDLKSDLSFAAMILSHYVWYIIKYTI